MESYLAWQAMETLTLRADYTYTEALDAATHLELLRRPRHKASLVRAGRRRTLSPRRHPALCRPQIDGNRDFSIPRLKMPDYVTADFAASYG